MHHTLRFYSSHRHGFLKLYMFLAELTGIPVIGHVVRWVGNRYGRNIEGAFLLNTEEAETIVDNAAGVAVGLCTCRHVFRNCDHPQDVELLLGPTRHLFMRDMQEDSREISKEEAKAILRDCRERGLIHSVIKCKNEFYAICNCCTCCCVPLRLKKEYGIGNAMSRHPDIVAEFREHQLALVAGTQSGVIKSE